MAAERVKCAARFKYRLSRKEKADPLPRVSQQTLEKREVAKGRLCRLTGIRGLMRDDFERNAWRFPEQCDRKEGGERSVEFKTDNSTEYRNSQDNSEYRNR